MLVLYISSIFGGVSLFNFSSAGKFVMIFSMWFPFLTDDEGTFSFASSSLIYPFV